MVWCGVRSGGINFCANILPNQTKWEKEERQLRSQLEEEKKEAARKEGSIAQLQVTRTSTLMTVVYVHYIRTCASMCNNDNV